MRVINEFKGSYRFLSNFYMVQTTFEGGIYPSSEHAYMAAKSLDPTVRMKIARCPTPKEAKGMGRQIALRADWEKVKYDVMLNVLRSKFSHHMLRDMLLATGDAQLIEGNWWGDKIWGVCLKTNQGQNLLGRALMVVRDELRNPLVKLPDITVVNKYHGLTGEYIGRGTPLGNKWTHMESKFPDVIKVTTRAEAVQHYATWLKQQVENNDPAVCDELNRLVDIAHRTGKLNLVCTCKPAQCHGDIIRETILSAWR